MVEISTIFYKRYIDSCGISYDKIMDFCKSRKWGDDFEGSGYADIIDQFQDAIIWILRKAKYYKSVDVSYSERLWDENYKYDPVDIEKSKVKVFRDFNRKMLCDYLMYYQIDESEDEGQERQEQSEVSYMKIRKTDQDVINVIDKIMDGLRYSAAEYFYNSAKQEGWIDNRVKGKVYAILQIREEEESNKDNKRALEVFSDKLSGWKDRFIKSKHRLRFT